MNDPIPSVTKPFADQPDQTEQGERMSNHHLMSIKNVWTDMKQSNKCWAFAVFFTAFSVSSIWFYAWAHQDPKVAVLWWDIPYATTISFFGIIPVIIALFMGISYSEKGK